MADAIYSDESAGWGSPEIVQTIAEKAVALCDPLDGVEDGLVSHSARCREVSGSIIEELRCEEGDDPSQCLNQTQIDRVIGVYHEGYTLPYEINGLSEYPGYNSLEGVVMSIGTQPDFINPPPCGPNAHHVNRAFQFVSNFVDTSEDFDLLEFDIQNLANIKRVGLNSARSYGCTVPRIQVSLRGAAQRLCSESATRWGGGR